MPIKIIRNDAKDLTQGETTVLNKIIYLYKDVFYDAYLYIQPTIGKLQPDFLIIDAKRGISIIEVKDWSIDYIKDINQRVVLLQNREEDNPIFKTKKYLDICIGVLSSEDNLDINDRVFGNTILINLSKDDTQNISQYLNHRLINCILQEDFKCISIDNLFDSEEFHLNFNEVSLVRTSFFPEIKIQQPTVEEIIKSLDLEQENFAKRLPYGHYMVTGVPGSGKTIILIARAIHLIKENPDWNIRILTFNKSLCSKIEQVINIITENFKENACLQNINTQNITVTTFHKMAISVANTTIPTNLTYSQKQDWWATELPSIALLKSTPTFDAILIDEYQDFRDEWIKLCINMCKEHFYTNNAGKEMLGINLFLAGDRLQSIYNPKVHNWAKDFGLNMRGRSKLLKTCYRAGKENVNLAIMFLQSHELLEEEVNNFYKDSTDLNVTVENKNDKATIEFFEGDYSSVSEKIENLVENGTPYHDILVLCKKNETIPKIIAYLPNCIQNNCIKTSDIETRTNTNEIIFTTYKSSKGLEAKVVILVDADKFTKQMNSDRDLIERKTMYVGITRASYNLLIHGTNFHKESFAQDLKTIFESK